MGLTFAAALRAFLRQDPDVIMVGEIRDHETAEIAIHASLTGHLVLSTLHTNDAAGAVTRLVEMEVQPFLISSSVLGVIAQRLVRKLCRTCKQPYAPSTMDLRSLGVDDERFAALRRPGVQAFRGIVHEHAEAAPAAPERVSIEPLQLLTPEELTELELELDEEPTRMVAADAITPALKPGGLPPDLASAIFYRAIGCDDCAQTGYKGRLAISEMLIIDEAVRRDILNHADAATISRTAIAGGMRTLREDGARLVLSGITSLEEVLAATQAAEME